MSSKFTRRDWLKSGALAAAGLSAFPYSAMSAVSSSAQNAPHYLAFQEEMKLLGMPDMPEMRARLLANENPFGPSEIAKKAFIDALPDSFRYSFQDKKLFAEMIAKKENVKPENVLLGAGSTELLDAASYYFALKAKGKKIICADPAYESLMRTAEAHGAERVAVPTTKDHKHNLDAMAEKVSDDTSLMYICNPANPNGTIVDPEELAAFCKQVAAKVPVFIDEAYMDYVENPQANSMIKLVAEGHNVLVARTFSKVHGFAGLRVGYMIAQEDMVKEISKFCSSGMTISGPAMAAAIASYQDQKFIDYCLQKNQESKQFFCKVLEENDFEYIPSHTNFVLFPLRMRGEQFLQEMMKHGVGVRKWEINKRHYSRVSMGTMAEMEIFAEAFKKVVG